ncbi:MAG: FtsQ-type protein [Bacillota bacterium]|jgi:hypothetical protein|nr:FtsQ-type protein [Bacillota bacterium]
MARENKVNKKHKKNVNSSDAPKKHNGHTKRVKRIKKKKFNKLSVSTAAFFTAAVIVVFCIYYGYYQTPYFNLVGIDVIGNKSYDSNYIIEKSEIELGNKILEVNKEEVKEKLEKEVYINNVRVAYELPNRIYIEISERQERYQILFNNEYIVTDNEGKVLNIYNEKSELITIESLSNVIYNIGENISIDGIKDIKSIFLAAEYCLNEYGEGIINKITVSENNSIILNTKYGTKIKVSLSDDINYQISFAMNIINDRLNNNLTVASDLIDFTKGDSPVYVEDDQVNQEKQDEQGEE